VSEQTGDAKADARLSARVNAAMDRSEAFARQAIKAMPMQCLVVQNTWQFRALEHTIADWHAVGVEMSGHLHSINGDDQNYTPPPTPRTDKQDR